MLRLYLTDQERKKSVDVGSVMMVAWYAGKEGTGREASNCFTWPCGIKHCSSRFHCLDFSPAWLMGVTASEFINLGMPSQLRW